MPLSNVIPENYPTLLSEKVDKIRAQFSHFAIPEPQVFESPATHFRMRAEFRIWHEGDDCYYCMFKKDDPKTPCRIDNFIIGCEAIDQLMPPLLSELKQSDILKHRLFQIEFLSTLSGETLVTLIYHKKLESEWEQLAKKLEEKFNIAIIGRSKKQRVVLSHDYVIENLTVGNREYKFQQIENSFTQPNAYINQKMLTWALENSKAFSNTNNKDLLELYCGNGNFSIVLAQNFDKVLATEISKTSVKSAHFNFDLNQISNITVARMSSEEFTSALNKERDFRRLKDINLDDYQFSSILVDPPRAGLDSETEKLVSRFDNIIYISCNPDTLHKNLTAITQTHEIKQFAIFDQFPYTHHTECGVILSKRA